MLVSVIMPVYKVEAYLPRAIESVLNQTFRDLELYLIDDGSPDRCGEICDAYAAKDPRVKVLHQKNQGAAAARNSALKLISGKYVQFTDADDCMEPTMLEHLVEAAEKEHADMAICGYYIDTDVGRGKIYCQTVLPKENAFFANAEQFHRESVWLMDHNLLYAPWNRLFLREILIREGICFPNTFWDDMPFNLAYFRFVNTAVAVKEPLYRFSRFRAESETAKYVPAMYEKREEEDGWLRDLYAQWHMTDEAEEFLARRYAERLIGCIENLTNPRCTLTSKEKKQKIRSMLATERAREALDKARPSSPMLKLMFLPLKKKAVSWTYVQSKFITFVKTKLSFAFHWLKSSRGKAAA